jgi:hypothetical protein
LSSRIIINGNALQEVQQRYFLITPEGNLKVNQPLPDNKDINTLTVSIA